MNRTRNSGPKTITPRFMAILFISCALAPTVVAQTGTDSTLGGTWAGNVDITAPDGHVEHAKGLLWLRTNGSHLSGGLGDNVDHLTSIKNGAVTDTGCHFLFSMHNTEIPFALKLEGHRLKGEGAADMGGSKLKIDLDLQPAPDVHTLYDQIATQDAKLFDAFNARDLQTVAGMFSKELEFYHDKEGVSGYAHNIAVFKKHFTESTKVRRELQDDSLEIYPIKEFGAIEVGVHRFYSTEPGNKERLTATAKFLHVWKNDKGNWQIVRVVSYDHE
jgi:hypothetical protein